MKIIRRGQSIVGSTRGWRICDRSMRDIQAIYGGSWGGSIGCDFVEIVLYDNRSVYGIKDSGQEQYLGDLD